MEGILFLENFIENANAIFQSLKETVRWDERMTARKTASFGIAYNYSQIAYPETEMPEILENICLQIEQAIGFKPNNCLINYYLDGKAKMGYHSDQTDILYDKTGICVVSLGETRILRFRNIADNSLFVNYELPNGSFIYMTQAVQNTWQHAVPASNTENGRMSLTFRKIQAK